MLTVNSWLCPIEKGVGAMDVEQLNKANKVGVSAAVLFGAGVLLATTSKKPFIEVIEENTGLPTSDIVSALGTSSLIIGLLLGLFAAYLAIDAYFA